MDPADSNFKACFIAIDDHGKEISKHVNREFKILIKHFLKCQKEDQDFCVENGSPQLTVISPDKNPYDSIQALSKQNLIILLDSQRDSLYWAIRDKLISDRKCYFLITLASTKKSKHRTYEKNESIISFSGNNIEKQIIKFVKDMCRVWMFPRLLSCDFFCMKNILSNTQGENLLFESNTADHMPCFRQFLSDNNAIIQQASGIFFIVSSNLGNDFSISEHLQSTIDEIQNAAKSECTIIGSDSLYAEGESALRVNMICARR